jgi:hypothetical protein
VIFVGSLSRNRHGFFSNVRKSRSTCAVRPSALPYASITTPSYQSFAADPNSLLAQFGDVVPRFQRSRCAVARVSKMTRRTSG